MKHFSVLIGALLTQLPHSQAFATDITVSGVFAFADQVEKRTIGKTFIQQHGVVTELEFDAKVSACFRREVAGFNHLVWTATTRASIKLEACKRAKFTNIDDEGCQYLGTIRGPDGNLIEATLASSVVRVYLSTNRSEWIDCN